MRFYIKDNDEYFEMIDPKSQPKQNRNNLNELYSKEFDFEQTNLQLYPNKRSVKLKNFPSGIGFCKKNRKKLLLFKHYYRNCV